MRLGSSGSLVTRVRRFRQAVVFACLTSALILAGCSSTNAVSTPVASPTPIVAMNAALPAPTATPVIASTPTHVPAGWLVQSSQYFSLAYPPDWSVKLPLQGTTMNADGIAYSFVAPAGQGEGVQVIIEQPSAATSQAEYCQTGAQMPLQQVTLAGLPMRFMPATGEGNIMRGWIFVTSQGTDFLIESVDAQATAADQATDDAILSTFTPANATPLSC